MSDRLFLFTLLDEDLPPAVPHGLHFAVAHPSLQAVSDVLELMLPPVVDQARHQSLPLGARPGDQLPLGEALAESRTAMSHHEVAQLFMGLPPPVDLQVSELLQILVVASV